MELRDKFDFWHHSDNGLVYRAERKGDQYHITFDGCHKGVFYKIDVAEKLVKAGYWKIRPRIALDPGGFYFDRHIVTDPEKETIIVDLEQHIIEDLSIKDNVLTLKVKKK